MRAEFVRQESPEEVVGVATWTGGRVEVTAENERSRAILSRIFRATPVMVDEPALRSAGARGPVVLPPGSLQWFGAAAVARAPAEGLKARLVPEKASGIGWDPAGAYRPFAEVVERSERAG